MEQANQNSPPLSTRNSSSVSYHR